MLLTLGNLCLWGGGGGECRLLYQKFIIGTCRLHLTTPLVIYMHNVARNIVGDFEVFGRGGGQVVHSVKVVSLTLIFLFL